MLYSRAVCGVLSGALKVSVRRFVTRPIFQRVQCTPNLRMSVPFFTMSQGLCSYGFCPLFLVEASRSHVFSLHPVSARHVWFFPLYRTPLPIDLCLLEEGS